MLLAANIFGWLPPTASCCAGAPLLKSSVNNPVNTAPLFWGTTAVWKSTQACLCNTCCGLNTSMFGAAVLKFTTWKISFWLSVLDNLTFFWHSTFLFYIIMTGAFVQSDTRSALKPGRNKSYIIIWKYIFLRQTIKNVFGAAVQVVAWSLKMCRHIC